MDKTRTVGQKWLANELDLHFLTLKKYKVIVLKNYKSTDRHIRENHFFSGSEGGLKTWSFDKNGGWGGGQILHKANTFSLIKMGKEKSARFARTLTSRASRARMSAPRARDLMVVALRAQCCVLHNA